MNDLDEIKNLIKKDTRIVFLGGAGVSTESGIPDFRSETGLYKMKQKYGLPYETMLSRSFFESDPSSFYDFYWNYMVYENAKPNLAHKALARFESEEGKITILTQNIDGLHFDAGSKNVLELHGSVRRYSCLNCHKRYGLNEISHQGVPSCKCGGIIKPDVVLYEESLDEYLLEEAIKSLQNADILIVGGTSLNVYPVAGLIRYFLGKARIIINKEKTNSDSYFDFVIHDDIGKVLDYLL